MEEREILVVEDDPDINNLLRAVMERAGHRAVQAFSGSEALLRLESSTPDLVLLDLMLPGVDGPELLARLRGGQGPDVPVIVVSAKAGLADKVDLLAAGADDYIVKPFEPDEVAARVEAVLRRSGSGGADGTGKALLRHRGLVLDADARSVTLDGTEVALTAHEFDILRTLMEAPGKVFSRERLYELVWKGGYYGEDNAVNVHVSNIRKKLARAGAEGEYVKTVWGIGFKLV